MTPVRSIRAIGAGSAILEAVLASGPGDVGQRPDRAGCVMVEDRHAIA
jgi:hypothetical protein